MDRATRFTPQPWMAAPSTRRVLAALEAAGGQARFVGGCVRDALLGRPVKDIDIATPLPPEAVMRALEDAGIKPVPTGLGHGTVTAVIPQGAAERGAGPDHFEITTLRRDVETYGRHARVAFTEDWAADATRRDFTINALFCDAQGNVDDWVGGLSDLAARRVRFVGDAETRLQEDYLRLLRFFRMQAHFGRPPADAAALAACRRHAAKLATLSAERIAHELLRLMEAPASPAVAALMAGEGILAHALPAPAATDRLAAIVEVERRAGLCAPVRRLAALLYTDAEGARRAAAQLRLSNAQRARVAALADWRPRIPTPPSPEDLRRHLYRRGAARFEDDLVLTRAVALAAGEDEALAAGEDEGEIADARWRAWLALPRRWSPPALPVSGHDVLRLGVPRGPRVRALLAAVETWWVERDFAPDRAACLERLKVLAVGA